MRRVAQRVWTHPALPGKAYSSERAAKRAMRKALARTKHQVHKAVEEQLRVISEQKVIGEQITKREEEETRKLLGATEQDFQDMYKQITKVIEQLKDPRGS